MVEDNRTDLERTLYEMVAVLRARRLAVFTIEAAYTYLQRREDVGDPRDIKQVIARVLKSTKLAQKLRRDGKDLRIRVMDNANPVRLFCLYDDAAAWAKRQTHHLKEAAHASAAVLAELEPRLVGDETK